MNTLIQHLRQVNLTSINKLSSCYQLLNNYQGKEWEKYIKIPEKGYGRELVHRDKQFEIYVITWPNKSGSHIHNHSENGCLMKVLRGNLVETLYNKDLIVKGVNTYSNDEIGYIDNTLGYHSINNPFMDMAVSLHIYSPYQHKTKFFYNI